MLNITQPTNVLITIICIISCIYVYSSNMLIIIIYTDCKHLYHGHREATLNHFTFKFLIDFCKDKGHFLLTHGINVFCYYHTY